MEAQLLEYRAKKRREAQIEHAKSQLSNLFSFTSKMDEKPDVDVPLLKDQDSSTSKFSQSYDIEAEDSMIENATISSVFRDNRRRIVYLVLWIATFLIFVKYQWGAVFFIISALIFIYANTRTGARRIGEISAYSVFNRNCKSIDGAVTAEQFEKEMRFSTGSMI